jgi:RNA polymerase sigma-70 factor (ECF subfamily)
MEAAELISRCKAGDSRALHLLYEQHKPKLLSICKQYTKETDVAEDLLHDAFVVILTSLDKLEDPKKLEAWMATIVRNVGYHYKDHLGKEKTTLQQLAKEKHETAETSLTPDYDELNALVALLPQGYQQVFRLSVFEGLSHQEISQLLGIAPHSSSSQLSHAKRMLRQLIKQSWLLVLLLIAIPTSIWFFHQKEEKTIEKKAQVYHNKVKKHQPQAPSPQMAIPKQTMNPALTIEAIDTTTYQAIEPNMEIDQESVNEEVTDTTAIEPNLNIITVLPSEEKPQLAKHAIDSNSWRISMSFVGIAGSSENYMAQATIGKSSFASASNVFIPTQFSNWVDYNDYLSNSPAVIQDAETRSINNIALQNSTINQGLIEARHEHKLPITLQVLLNKQLTKRLSIETGLSYTQLNSTTTTGSSDAYIQEQQKIHYLGIPLRFGWQWYSKAHFSLYSSVGIMLEIPIQSHVNIQHRANGITSFEKKTSINAPNQLSGSLGLGLQYNLTPYLGIYLEPSLQYFYDEDSNLETYRTEHPLQITLPLGIRFHW